MKKITLCLFLLFGCGILSTSFAQERATKSDKFEYVLVPIFQTEHEVRVGYGYSPRTSGYEFMISSPQGIEEYSTENKFLLGAINVDYSYKFNRWLEVGGILSYSGIYRDLVSYSDNSNIGYRNTNYFILMGTVRFNYFTHEYVRLYSSISLGMSTRVTGLKDNDVDIVLTDFSSAAQLSLLGITVGKKFFGSAELLTFGVTGTLLKVGVGYRWDAR